MARLVISVVGDDRAGLVEALSGAIADHGGNWEQSQLAELAGTFAGVVLATVADDRVDALTAALDAIEASGLLHISVAAGAAADEGTPPATRTNRLDLRLVGQDHPGIVHEISQALAEQGINIEEFQSAVVPAPMGGGQVFEASALLHAPEALAADEIRAALESLAHDLMVDLDLAPHPG